MKKENKHNNEKEIVIFFYKFFFSLFGSPVLTPSPLFKYIYRLKKNKILKGEYMML